ncbi:2-hydroxychromene-2-carboxylate isomerase [Amorphus coralli]|uniref:2-hydroxychromene-2-carboxylate isomerase n=1 Tax=Amorphus coralli TaxID=340680 RepID=UPI0003680069|nr:2-hydroxychromene-2-carboxylate isomerase [Amorphus coralli]
MGQPVLDFFYDFASPYSYLSAARIEALAETHAIMVRWRPFLLGPIFRRQGWNTSPFNVYPAKGRYMWRDVGRLSSIRELPLVQPDPFPQNGLLAARCVLSVTGETARAEATRAIFHAGFGEGAQISDPDVVRAALDGAGLDGTALLAAAAGDAAKMALRTNTDEAVSHGIFGAPSFVASDGEMFWGDDRIDDAIRWTVGRT